MSVEQGIVVRGEESIPRILIGVISFALVAPLDAARQFPILKMRQHAGDTGIKVSGLFADAQILLVEHDQPFLFDLAIEVWLPIVIAVAAHGRFSFLVHHDFQ
jgi:hypothetical protein